MLRTNETIASAAKAAPLITREQEHEDAVAWLSNGDLAARERLFRSHLRIVVKIATQMQGRATIDELQAEGCIGLLKAIDRFDPESGFRLSTYSRFWIKAEAVKHLHRHLAIVRLPETADLKVAISHMRRTRRMVGIEHDSRLSDRELDMVSERMRISKETVRLADLQRSGIQVSTNAPLPNSGVDGAVTTLQDSLVSSDLGSHDLLQIKERESWASRTLAQLMEGLTERERDIYVRREIDGGETLEDLSKDYGVSRERIRQIQEKAKAKIAKKATKHASWARAHFHGSEEGVEA